MSKKTILNETQIRRFMKLATIEPLADPFVGRRRFLGEQLDDEGADPVEDEMMGADDEGGLDDMMGPDAGAEGPEGPVDVESLVSAIADAIESEIPGVQINVGGEGGEEGMHLDDEAIDAMEPDEAMGAGMAAANLMSKEGIPPEAMQEYKRRRYVAYLQEQRMRQYIRARLIHKLQEARARAHADQMRKEGKHSDFSGAGLADQGSNSDRTFESDDNRQSSAGQHHTGGGKAKASRQHMGGNTAGLPLEEAVLDKLTRRVAARLLNNKRRRR